MACQAAHIYAWVKARTGFEPSFRVVFYPAEYFRRMLGIFPIGDPTQYIPDSEVLSITPQGSDPLTIPQAIIRRAEVLPWFGLQELPL